MRWIVIAALCAILFGVHVCAILVLAKNKSLFQNKFIRLALYLSFSDACMLVEYIWHMSVFNLKGEDDRNEFQYQCIILKYLLGGTIVFSALQMFLICLERLKSTFAAPHKIFRILTGNVSVLICLAGTHSIAVTMAIVDILQGKGEDEPKGCSPDFSLQGHFLLTFDVPIILFVLLIVICYSYTMLKIYKQIKKVRVENLTEIQKAQRKSANRKMKRNMITLTSIIVVNLLAILPRSVYGLYINMTGFSANSKDIIRVTSNFLLLNALVDPFIYIFHIQRFRTTLFNIICRNRRNRIHVVNVATVQEDVSYLTTVRSL